MHTSADMLSKRGGWPDEGAFHTYCTRHSTRLTRILNDRVIATR